MLPSSLPAVGPKRFSPIFLRRRCRRRISRIRPDYGRCRKSLWNNQPGRRGWGGTVFELTPTNDGWKHQVLPSFADGTNDGGGPTAGLVFDSAGNLDGTTAFGGGSNCYGSGCGTVFKLALNWYAAGAKAFYLVSQEQTATAGPNSDLIFDRQGNLYGTAGGGTATGFCGGILWGEVWWGTVFAA